MTMIEPIYFKEANHTITSELDDGVEIPALYDVGSDDGLIVTVYKVPFLDRLRILITGKLTIEEKSFHDPICVKTLKSGSYKKS